MKVAKCWAYQSAAAGIAKVWQGAVDEMKKTPIFISANSCGRGSYALVDEEGQAALKTQDHDFPLAPAFLMSLGGVVECLTQPDLKKLKATRRTAFGKALVPTLRPSRVHGFLRSHR